MIKEWGSVRVGRKVIVRTYLEFPVVVFPSRAIVISVISSYLDTSSTKLGLQLAAASKQSGAVSLTCVGGDAARYNDGLNYRKTTVSWFIKEANLSIGNNLGNYSTIR